jgi:ELWxxDGT repeat protein
VLLSPVLEHTLALDLDFGPPQWTRLGSRLLFRGWDPDHGFELWATDGTPGGTVLVRDIAPGPGSSSPQWLTLAGASLFFSADFALTGREPWVLPLQ